jgi:S1-C subfamily serine protease
MIPPVIALLALAGPEVVHPAVARDAVLSAEAQWRAIPACLRVVGKDGSFGTAFVVGHKDGYAYILTAAHVVPTGVSYEFQTFTRDSHPLLAKAHQEGIQTLFREEKPDVALVRVKLKKGEDPLPELKLAGPGQRPKRFPFAAVSVGGPFGSAPVARAEQVTSKYLKLTGERPDGLFWQTAAKPEKGRSGGPLLDAEGRVIGICAAFKGEKGYFTHHDEILAALKQNGHDWLWK